ncbi:MAG: ABC transporter ATP-binding protein [Actinobacteria bacterium]|nr:ABC transporter ATP-binding protein [Actinomycetota bacterium]
MPDVLLEASDLRVQFGGGRDIFLRRSEAFEALRGVSFTIHRGEAFALVGESGAGKSTAAKCVVGLQEPTSGDITFDGAPLNPRKDGSQRRAIQMVFQDPYSSLNPRMKVGAAITELLRVNGLADSKQAARERAAELLSMVGLPEHNLDRRPNAFSGGQRQRVGIARALAAEPTLLVADEPVSALDVSIQASILILLKRLQKELGLTMLFISHDLAVVKQLCDRVAVMSEGAIVEEGTVDKVFADPQHEFTRRLLDATTDLPPLETRSARIDSPAEAPAAE